MAQWHLYEVPAKRHHPEQTGELLTAPVQAAAGRFTFTAEKGASPWRAAALAEGGTHGTHTLLCD